MHKLLEIVEKSRSFICDFHLTCVLYIGGTCDLTTKVSKLIAPSFPTYVDLCTHMMSTFKLARNRASELSPELKIPLVVFVVCNKQPEIHPLQSVINDTLDTLNYAIRADNILHNIHLPTLTSKIHLKHKGKKQHNKY